MPQALLDQVGLISFVVPLHNHLRHSQQMLSSLLASLPEGLDFEVILVDDASSDGTSAWLAGLDHPRVRWLINPQNLGYAETNNRGVAEARGKVIGLLNNDLIFSSGWLVPMLNLLTQPLRNAGVVGNVQRRVSDGEIDHAGIRLNLKGQFEHVRVLTAGKAWARLPWVTGACVLIWRDLFQEVRGFDTRYRNGCEDVDLCFKVAATGKAIYVALDSCIQHHVSLSRGGPGGAGGNSQQNERNSRALFARWRSEIKQHLAAAWCAALQAGQPLAEDELDGALQGELAASPVLAGRLLAEAMLDRQEARWATLLDGADVHSSLASRCSSQGLRREPALGGGYIMGEAASFAVEGLAAAESFHVCGRVLPEAPVAAFRLVVTVNGLQAKHFEVARGENFNLGVYSPLLLPGMRNGFSVSVEAGQGRETAVLAKAVLITHWVVDDRVLQVVVD